MKKHFLSLLCLLPALTVHAASCGAFPIVADSIVLYGNCLAGLAQRVEIGMHNATDADYEGRLYLLACNMADGSITPCTDTLVSVEAHSGSALLLYPALPEGRLELRLSTDADGTQCIATDEVTILPLRKLGLEAVITLHMLADSDGEPVVYGSRISGWARVTNHDTPYYGVHGGTGDDDGIALWIEDSDNGRRLFTKHVAKRIEYYGTGETAFAYDAVFRDGARYALKIGYAMPYGLQSIDSLCFTTRTGTNTYWTAQGQVLPLTMDNDRRLVVPPEAVAVDLRGQQDMDAAYAIDTSQANPNCLYYIDPLDSTPQGLDDRHNLVRGSEAGNIRLTEGHDYYCPMAFKTRLISYLMTPSYSHPDDEAIGRGYSETIVLPFHPDQVCLYDVNAQSEMLHADMLKVLHYEGHNADTLNVIMLNSLSQMEPYTPYILGVYIGSSLLFIGTDTKVPMTTEAVARGNGLDFVGTTVGMGLSSDCYIYQPGCYTFRQGESGDAMAPFHACLQASYEKRYSHLDLPAYAWGESGKPGDSTAISEIPPAALPSKANVVSDLSGRQIPYRKLAHSKLPKGIYIVSGRKLVLK